MTWLHGASPGILFELIGLVALHAVPTDKTWLTATLAEVCSLFAHKIFVPDGHSRAQCALRQWRLRRLQCMVWCGVGLSPKAQL
eukprot:2302131-Amphidinium_carterae.3